MGEKNKYGYKHDDGHYSKMTGNDKNSSYSIYDKNPSEPDHSVTHININTDTGCYLTSAFMQHHLSKFDDNCYELQILRWFRDNFVSQEDIEHYYQTAPMVVTEIEKQSNSNNIYNEIYHNVIEVCVRAIEQKKYNLAYNIYKDSILNLEEQFGRPALQKRLVMALGNKRKMGLTY